MSEAHTVCVPGSRVAKFARNEAFSHVGLYEKCMTPALSMSQVENAMQLIIQSNEGKDTLLRD